MERETIPFSIDMVAFDKHSRVPKAVTPSPQPDTPLGVFSEEPLDIFYFYLGLLRDTLKEVSPETWRSLLNQTPPPTTQKGTQK